MTSEFVSCEFIENRLILDFDKIFICNCPQGDVQASNPVCDYSGGKLPIEAILNKRDSLRHLNNENISESPCKGCPQLKSKQWDDGADGYFDMVIVNNFVACNLACKYCYTVLRNDLNLSKYYYRVLPVIKEILANNYLMATASIAWAGGEPTILKEFEAVSDLIMSKGYLQTVNTSGVKYSKSIEKGLIDRKVFVNISLDSGTRETYRRIKGKDCFNQVVKNVRRYASTTGALTLKYIIMDDNSAVEDIIGFIDVCRLAGVNVISVAPEQGELTRNNISDRSLYAAALLAVTAAKHNIACEIQHDNFTPKFSAKINDYILDLTTQAETETVTELKNRGLKHKTFKLLQNMFNLHK